MAPGKITPKGPAAGSDHAVAWTQGAGHPCAPRSGGRPAGHGQGKTQRSPSPLLGAAPGIKVLSLAGT